MRDEPLAFRVGIGNSFVRVIRPDRTCTDIACIAVRRRFSDASMSGLVGHARAEAWTAGNDAAALRTLYNQRKEGPPELDTRALTFFEDWSKLRLDDLDRWRFLVALLATVRAELAAQLETASGIATIFCISEKEKALSVKTEGEAEESEATPPFWLVYALRRLRWPGSVHLSFAENPVTSLATLSQVHARSFSPLPMLQHTAGTWAEPPLAREARPVHNDISLEVRLQADTGQPSTIAPRLAALPVVENFRFQDRRGNGNVGRGPLTLFLRRGELPDSRTLLTVSRGDPKEHGEEIGFVEATEAPDRSSAPYTLRAEVDEWGRFRASIFDPLGMPLPIVRANTETKGRQATRLISYSLHVDNLLFPNAADHQLLSRVPLLMSSGVALTTFEDAIDLLDLTSFNGKPAEPRSNNSARERYSLQPADFWAEEKGWLAKALTERDVERIELAAAALEATVDPALPETRLHSFREAPRERLQALVDDGKLLPHLDGDRMSEQDVIAGEDILASGTVSRAFRALRRLLPDELARLGAELETWSERRSPTEHQSQTGEGR